MAISVLLSLVWRLVALALALGAWGWWLAAFSVPISVVGVVVVLVVYGLGTSWGSVVPSSAAISLMVTLVILLDAFPPFWPTRAPYRDWAFTVLVLWAISLAATGLLAMVGHRLRQVPSPYRESGRLAILVGLLFSLWVGARLYQIQWPGWVFGGNL